MGSQHDYGQSIQRRSIGVTSACRSDLRMLSQRLHVLNRQNDVTHIYGISTARAFSAVDRFSQTPRFAHSVIT